MRIQPTTLSAVHFGSNRTIKSLQQRMANIDKAEKETQGEKKRQIFAETLKKVLNNSQITDFMKLNVLPARAGSPAVSGVEVLALLPQIHKQSQGQRVFTFQEALSDLFNDKAEITSVQKAARKLASWKLVETHINRRPDLGGEYGEVLGYELTDLGKDVVKHHRKK